MTSSKKTLTSSKEILQKFIPLALMMDNNHGKWGGTLPPVIHF